MNNLSVLTQFFIFFGTLTVVLVVLFAMGAFDFLFQIYKNSKLRIVKVITVGEEVTYKIQKRFLFFWVNALEHNGYGGYKIIFTNVLQAKEYIDAHIEKSKMLYELRKNSKIKKTEIVQDFEIYERKFLKEKINDINSRS